jgi:hypothetical protein
VPLEGDQVITYACIALIMAVTEFVVVRQIVREVRQLDAVLSERRALREASQRRYIVSESAYR